MYCCKPVSGARWVLSLLLLVAASSCSLHPDRFSSNPAPPVQAEAATPFDTSPERFLGHIALLAHDELKGRATGEEGIDLAAGYIAGQFAAAGLEPGGPNGTYFQEFSVQRSAEVLDTTSLEIDGAATEPILKADFIPFGFSPAGGFEGDVVFVGYGITSPDNNHDDYAGIDVTDKVLLMLRRKPSGFDRAEGDSDPARFDQKVKLAAKHSATAVLIVNRDPGEDGIDDLNTFRSRGQDFGLPALHLKRHLGDELLAAGGLPSLAELQQEIDENGRNVSASLTSVRITGNVEYKTKEIVGRNVIGLLPGTGPHANEHLVIGAHYDHIGVRRGRIHNGADDNASGTAGVIELARMMARTPERDRGLVFIAFSAEEIGLNGSEHFVENPTVRPGSITAMINLDMIGRMTPDKEANMLGIQGLGTGGSFKQIVERRAKEAEIEFIPEDSAKGPSDHYSFYEGGIPALFFNTGGHSDLHQPSDDLEKINAEGAARIVSLIYSIAKDILNTASAPVFAEVEQRARFYRGAASGGGGVVMGIMPDMDDDSDEPGWRVARVFPNGGAFKAGIKDGDRIIRIDGSPLNGMQDYRRATAGKEPGDVIDVTLLRGQEELTLAVQLSARRGR